MSESALFTLPALRRARDLIDRDYEQWLDLDAMASYRSDYRKTGGPPAIPGCVVMMWTRPHPGSADQVAGKG